MPQGFDSSVPPIAAATADDLSMVRFHGRNREAWTVKTESAADRFKYDYSEEELGEWVPRLQQLASETRETHVLMNNCYRDFAVRNAAELGDLLRSGPAVTTRARARLTAWHPRPGATIARRDRSVRILAGRPAARHADASIAVTSWMNNPESVGTVLHHGGGTRLGEPHLRWTHARPPARVDGGVVIA